MSNFSINKGDIVLAPFHFTESEGAKLRPALVWDVTPVSATLIYIGSVKTDKKFGTEFILYEEDAKAIGLSKESRIDFNKQERILIVDVGKKLGHLQNLQRSRLKGCFQAAIAAGLI